MKKLASVLCVMAMCSLSAMAGSWTGVISESGCGAKHSTGDAKDQGCVSGCVKKGAAPVFVTEDKKVLKISNPAKVMEHLGHKVSVTGNVEGESLTIESVSMAH